MDVVTEEVRLGCRLTGREPGHTWDMSETPQNPSPESAALPDQDIGDDRESIPGTGPVAAGDVPPEPDAQSDTSGPDSHCRPTRTDSPGLTGAA